jgi:hypothetical protein
MMGMYTIQNTDAVKQMVSEGKVVGPRKGAFSVFGGRRLVRRDRARRSFVGPKQESLKSKTGCRCLPKKASNDVENRAVGR